MIVLSKICLQITNKVCNDGAHPLYARTKIVGCCVAIHSASMDRCPQPTPKCKKRPVCGGATFCDQCAEVGLSRVNKKLIQGSVMKPSLGQLIKSVWPEASESEVVVISNLLLKKGIAVMHKDGKDLLEHRFWPAMRSLRDAAVVPIDAEQYLSTEYGLWAAQLLTSNRCAAVGLHIFVQASTSRFVVRQKTALNAVDMKTLESALRQNGVRGVPLEVIYKEYPRAHSDIFKLCADRLVTIDENLAWHSANVPGSTPGAAEAWQQSLGLYKPQRL